MKHIHTYHRPPNITEARLIRFAEIQKNETEVVNAKSEIKIENKNDAFMQTHFRIESIQNLLPTPKPESKIKVPLSPPERLGKLDPPPSAPTDLPKPDKIEDIPKGPKAPETHGDRIKLQMQNSVNNLKAAVEKKDMAGAFAAFLEMMGTISEYVDRAFKGRLNELLTKPEEKTQPGEQNNSTPKDQTPPERVQQKLEEVKNNKNPAEAPKDLPQNIERIKKENTEKIDSNKNIIKESRESSDKLKVESKTFIDQKAVLEKSKTDLQGQKNVEDKMAQIDSQIKNLEEKIASNAKTITDLETLATKKEEENKKLTEEQKVLDGMKTDVPLMVRTVNEMLKAIPFLKVTFNIDPQGKWKLMVEGMPPELQQRLAPNVPADQKIVDLDPKTLRKGN